MPKTDHDILIEMQVTLKKLCDTLAEVKKDNKEDHQTISNDLKTKISNKLFFWSTGIVVAIVMSLTAYTGVVKNEVVKNTTCIERIEKAIHPARK